MHKIFYFIFLMHIFPKYSLQNIDNQCFKNNILTDKNNNAFEKDIENALSILRNHKNEIQKMNPEWKAEALSIVFPEGIRYNAFKDFFETKSLELFYVEYGKEKADFSIGYFQMKPSFIEKLENYISVNTSLSNTYKDILRFKNNDEKEKRKERIARLKEMNWQLRYAYAYWAVCNEVFKSIEFKNIEEKIKFFATAYNTGFDKDVNTIKQWMNKRTFPYGPRYQGEQMIYCEVSHMFYIKYSHEF